MSKTRLMTAATIGVAGLLLTGCGSAAPGVAVKVGDEVLTVRDVDAATSPLLHGGRRPVRVGRCR